MGDLFSLFINSVFIGNILLAYFLGMCSFLQRFIKHSAHVAASLHGLLHKCAPWIWGNNDNHYTDTNHLDDDSSLEDAVLLDRIAERGIDFFQERLTLRPRKVFERLPCTERPDYAIRGNGITSARTRILNDLLLEAIRYRRLQVRGFEQQ